MIASERFFKFVTGLRVLAPLRTFLANWAVFGKFSSLSTHRFLMRDWERNEALAKAVKDIVRPGDIVVDLGAGTGFLSVLACKAGAKRVYAIERQGIADVAQRVAEANGVADRIVLIRKSSLKVKLPEKADVLISETLGHVGIDEDIVRYVSDGRRRFLKAGGKIIPSDIQVLAVPVESNEDGPGLWDQKFCGVDYSPIVEGSFTAPMLVRLRSRNGFLSEPKELLQVDLYRDRSFTEETSAEFEVVRSGRLHGFLVFFRSSAAPGAVMTNEVAGNTCNWDQGFLPAHKTTPVVEGQRISLTVRFGGYLFPDWKWSYNVSGESSQKGAVQHEGDTLGRSSSGSEAQT